MAYREETTCNEPLLAIDRQMALNIVHQEGKVCSEEAFYLHFVVVMDVSATSSLH